MGGRGRWISEFKANLVYKVCSRTARATQRNPVSKNKKKKKKDNVIVNLAPNRKWKRQVIKLGSGLKKLGSRDRAL